MPVKCSKHCLKVLAVVCLIGEQETRGVKSSGVDGNCTAVFCCAFP